MIQFKCPRCGAKMIVPGEMVGQDETCPECNHAVRIRRVPESSAAGGSGCPTSSN